MDESEAESTEPGNSDGGRRLSDGGINQLFAACDLNGSGFIEREELRAICNELTSEELADVFKQLDSDEDGKISLEEFNYRTTWYHVAPWSHQLKHLSSVCTTHN